MNRWPWRGDGPTAVGRKVALAYRAALWDVDPKTCRAIDVKMREWGQGWAVPRVHRADDDDWLAAWEAADLVSVHPDTVGDWRRSGRLVSGVDCEWHRGRWRYRAGSIRAMADNVRRRDRGTT